MGFAVVSKATTFHIEMFPLTLKPNCHTNSDRGRRLQNEMRTFRLKSLPSSMARVWAAFRWRVTCPNQSKGAGDHFRDAAVRKARLVVPALNG